jgi:hypothetical protein
MIIMKKNLTTILLSVAVISTSCLFVTHGSHEQYWRDQEQARVLQSGIATCGQRLMQSFNAWSALQNTSSVLSESFRNDTEACFAEAMQISREAAALRPLENALNSLTSEVHYINSNIILVETAKLTSGIAGAREDIVDKYNRYEENLDRIQSDLDQTISSAQAEAANSKLAAIIFSTFSFLSLIAMFVNEQKRKNVKNNIERRALELMAGQLDTQPAQAQGVIESALEFADLQQTKLLLKVNSQMNAPIEVAEQNASLQVVPAVNISEREKLLTIKEAQVISSDFSQVFTDVYEKMSARIFALGIVCDMDLEAQANVCSNSEDLIQLIHASLNLAMKKLNPDHRKLTINTKKVADILFYRIHIPQMCFNADEMEINQNKINDVLVELQILAASADGLNASLLLKNRFSAQSNEMSECIIEITLKAANQASVLASQNSGRELTQIVKMSKRELSDRLKKELASNA